MVFYGEFLVSSSGLNRFILPKKIREQLKGNIFILTKSFEFCLSGYDKESWEEKIKLFFNNPLPTSEQLAKQRFIFSSMTYVEIDQQGRFVIPKNLSQFAQITNQAMIIGVGDRFEVWEPKKWSDYQKKYFFKK